MRLLKRQNATTARTITTAATPMPMPAMAPCDRPDAASGDVAGEVSLTLVAVLEGAVVDDAKG